MKSINARGDIYFVLHCGDISDFEVTREFELQRDILCRLNVPFVVLLGNHEYPWRETLSLGFGLRWENLIRTTIWGGTGTTFESGTALFIPYYIRPSCESEVPVPMTLDKPPGLPWKRLHGIPLQIEVFPLFLHCYKKKGKHQSV